MKPVHPRSVGLLGVCVLAAMLAGCLRFPLGDPEKSTIDPKLVGFWLWEKEDEGVLAAVYPHDERTYVVEQFDFEKQGTGPRVKRRLVYKAWLTPVGGKTFMTLEPLVQRLPGTKEDQKYYAVVRVAAAGKDAEIQPLNAEFEPLKGANSAAEVAAVVARELGNPKMYAEETSRFRRLDVEADAPQIEKIIQPAE